MSSQNPREGMTSLPKASRSPVVVHGSIQFDLPSCVSGRSYRIFVFKPAASPPPSGYPVVVVTDGNLSFPLFATMSAGFEFAGQAALVVGVGYPTDDPIKLVSLRTRDLTPPTPLEGIPHRPGQPEISLEDYGGSELFSRFLVEELRPAITSAYAVSASNQTLYGHSWGACSPLRSSSSTRHRSAPLLPPAPRSGGTSARCSPTNRTLRKGLRPERPRPAC